MKILLVDLEYDYGDPSRGPNNIRLFGYEEGLKKLGHNVVNFFYDKYLNNTEPLQNEVLKQADLHKPDLIFFILFRDHFKIETLQKLKSKYKTLNWFGDDNWRFDSFTKKYATSFSYCVTTDKFSLSKYHQLGQKNVISSQWSAFERAKLSEFKGQYKYDISFIGAKNPYRAWFIKQLLNAKVKVDCFGYGWKNGIISNEEMNNIFRHSKINLNISNSNHSDMGYVFSSIKTFLHHFKSKKNSEQIKARNFEIPFAGGFQLTNYVPTIEDYFTLGHEIACYTNFEDLVNLINYYLLQDNERETLRQAGTVRARNEHGYSHRLNKVLESLSS